MFFTRRNARDLEEIKALAYRHQANLMEVLERLGHIEEMRLQRLTRRSRDPTLIGFVHIPKTAGGTATNMLARAYSAAGVDKAGNYMTGPEETVRKLQRRPGGWDVWLGRGGRVAVGHVPYRVFRKHLPPETRYITFLRDPIDRVLSHYYRHIHNPNLTPEKRRQAQERRRERAASLEEALGELRLPHVRNLATRFLCGHPTPREELAPSALENAKENLRNFAFVGIQERFEESIILLQRTLGLEVVPFLNRHVSEDRPQVDEISTEQRALIEEHNQLDAELYRFGQELFDDAVAASSPGLALDVEELRAISTYANAEAMQEARAWLERALPVGVTRSAASLREEGKAAGVPGVALKLVLRELESGWDADGQKTLKRRRPPTTLPAA
jgi:hypothetical protein